MTYMREDIQINDRARQISDQLIEKISTISDPEIGLDIYNLGLIYAIHLDEEGTCEIRLTFTGMRCECIESVPVDLEKALLSIPGIKKVVIQIVWSPAWKMTRISRFGRIALGVNPN